MARKRRYASLNKRMVTCNPRIGVPPLTCMYGDAATLKPHGTADIDGVVDCEAVIQVETKCSESSHEEKNRLWVDLDIETYQCPR